MDGVTPGGPHMTTQLTVTIAAAALAAGVFATDALAQPPAPRQERVTFAAGGSATTIQGRASGSDTVDYVVRASAGQTLAVTLKGTPSTAFNVLPPGSPDAAMFVNNGVDPFKGLLPADGDYAIRVYLVRAAARRGAAASYSLSISVTGSPLPPLAGTRDALVKGTGFHATASIRCVPNPYGDQTPKPCEAGVVRRGRDGTATVDVSIGDARRRRILFVAGTPRASDSSESMTVTRTGDTTVVTFASGERHEIPDAFLTGG